MTSTVATSPGLTREKMVIDPESGYKVEGYWADAENTNSVFPFLIKSNEPFLHKDEFLKMLKLVEENTETEEYWGYARSRFEPDVELGGSEYKDSDNKVLWTVDFRPYYVEKFNVQPSDEFKDYVLTRYKQIMKAKRIDVIKTRKARGKERDQDRRNRRDSKKWSQNK